MRSQVPTDLGRVRFDKAMPGRWSVKFLWMVVLKPADFISFHTVTDIFSQFLASTGLFR